MIKKGQKQMPMIVVNHGVRELHTNFLYVNQALDGNKLTPLGLAIRCKARELGGIEME